MQTNPFHPQVFHHPQSREVGLPVRDWVIGDTVCRVKVVSATEKRRQEHVVTVCGVGKVVCICHGRGVGGIMLKFGENHDLRPPPGSPQPYAGHSLPTLPSPPLPPCASSFGPTIVIMMESMVNDLGVSSRECTPVVCPTGKDNGLGLTIKRQTYAYYASWRRAAHHYS